MENSQFNYLKIKGADVAYLGSLASSKILLFIGRSNAQKNSAPLQELLDGLVLDGYLLVWPKSRNQLTGELLTQKSMMAIVWLNLVFGQNESQAKAWIRRILKGLILIGHPSKWDYFVSWFKVSSANEQAEIYKDIIRTLGKKKLICILSHSAGGITASCLANEDNRRRIICFGYPFKHPDKDEEPYRTNGLKNIQKPFLIIQGLQDEYGGIDVLRKYELSPNVEFEFIEANHEYDKLSPNTWIQVTNRIKSFLDQR